LGSGLDFIFWEARGRRAAASSRASLSGVEIRRSSAARRPSPRKRALALLLPPQARLLDDTTRRAGTRQRPDHAPPLQRAEAVLLRELREA